MKKITFFLSTTFLLGALLIVPLVAGAEVTGQSLGLFPCDGPDCTFQHIVQLADKIVNALFVIIMIVAPVLIARAGYYYIISSDKPGERAKANGQLVNLVVGLVIVACAYAVVKLVLGVLINTSVIKVPF